MSLGIVTGGARGIGLGIVRALLDQGIVDEVVVLDRDPAVLDGPIDVIACDVTDADAVADAAEQVGRSADVVVNNAGGTPAFDVSLTPAELFDPFGSVEAWRSVVDLNLTSAFIVTRTFGPSMGDGSAICNVASIAGSIPTPLYSYGAAKAGLLHWTRELAQALAPRRIRVNAVAPGFVYTRLWEGLLPDRADFDAMVGGQAPMGSEQTAEDIGAAVAYLCGPAAGQVTGQCIAVDGGTSNRSI